MRRVRGVATQTSAKSGCKYIRDSRLSADRTSAGDCNSARACARRAPSATAMISRTADSRANTRTAIAHRATGSTATAVLLLTSTLVLIGCSRSGDGQRAPVGAHVAIPELQPHDEHVGARAFVRVSQPALVDDARPGRVGAIAKIGPDASEAGAVGSAPSEHDADVGRRGTRSKPRCRHDRSYLSPASASRWRGRVSPKQTRQRSCSTSASVAVRLASAASTRVLPVGPVAVECRGGARQNDDQEPP